MQQLSMTTTKRKSLKGIYIVLCSILVFALAGCSGSGTVDSTSMPTPQATQQAQPTQIPTSQSMHYPPRTIADFHGLAAKGDSSAINEFHSESVGAVGVSPQPKREVTVDPSVTGQQLAED